MVDVSFQSMSFSADSLRRLERMRSLKWWKRPREKHAILHISYLIAWANHRGYSVITTMRENTCVDACEKFIMLNCKRGYERALCFMLHECGHILVSERQDYAVRFPVGYIIGEGRTLMSKIQRLEEEVLAWDEGFKLMKKMKIDVDSRRFEMIKSECLKSHFEIVNDRKLQS